MVYKWLQQTQRGIYPATCMLCAAPDTQNIDICTNCWHDLPHNNSHCHICAQPLPANHDTQHTCGNCLQQPPGFDLCHAPFTYSYPVSGLISEFKFNSKLHIGRLLSQLFIHFIATRNLELPELIMPVPLHPTRLKERGFNQALELAKPIARHFDIPLDIASCRRIKATEAQSSLHKKIRIKNMRGAFDVVQIPDCEHLVLIDDVVTTGATVSELARTVKSAGVTKVDVWALAKTP